MRDMPRWARVLIAIGAALAGIAVLLYGLMMWALSGIQFG